MKTCRAIVILTVGALLLALCVWTMVPSSSSCAGAVRSITKSNPEGPTRRYTDSGMVDKGSWPNTKKKSSRETYTQSGIASWYSRKECSTQRNINALTASGCPLNDNAFTCAHPYLPMGTRLLVDSCGKSVVVVVNDRGPSAKMQRKGRIIDLTKRAFSELCDTDRGLVHVSVKELR